MHNLTTEDQASTPRLRPAPATATVVVLSTLTVITIIAAIHLIGPVAAFVAGVGLAALITADIGLTVARWRRARSGA